MGDRVDKNWKSTGLTQYSTTAILGTLGHYGVPLDEAAARSLTAEQYPLELAATWKEKWQGKGQFLTYPFAAANELSARLNPERLTPMSAAHVLLSMVAAGSQLVSGQGGDFARAYGDFESMVPKMPPPGDRRDIFSNELVGYLESIAEAFNALPENLATRGHRNEAMQFARVHEELFPDRKGIVTALVRAFSGEREEALAELTNKVSDANVDVYERYAALDALTQLQHWPAVKAHGPAVFDAAAAAEKWRLGDTIAHLLAHVAENETDDAAFLREAELRLERAHASGGGHH